MKKLKKIKKYSFLVLVILQFLSCKKINNKEIQSKIDVLPYYNEASFTPKWLASKSGKLKSFHKIPDFSLTNQNGKIITQKTFKGKIYVADFFFTTCPGICLKMTNNMSLVQEAYKDDDEILIISHSVTPKKDAVSQLKKYALEHNINKNWHLVTGDKKEIYDLGRMSYFVEEDLGEPKGIDDFLHTENFILIDKNKYIRGIYNGLNKNSVKQLIADIKTLKIEM
ncbi:SCO family protein [Polaribacter sp. Hel1_85]|uniref:SCO family protein n=1 Tax=Polaribacter sp. Hel1_85 TaxID=1250005 RepID=UPI00052B6060|nr:SCO family protein [Polaribacter sp. Hel1_85]KGL63620.1 SCO2/SenC family protein [Polaribacter sp. Hel1_85]